MIQLENFSRLGTKVGYTLRLFFFVASLRNHQSFSGLRSLAVLSINFETRLCSSNVRIDPISKNPCIDIKVRRWNIDCSKVTARENG